MAPGSCGCTKGKNYIPMTDAVQENFWAQTKQIHNEKDELERETKLFIYYKMPGYKSHAALAFSEDKKRAFTVELIFGEEEGKGIPVTPFTQLIDNVSNKIIYHRIPGVQLLTSPKKLYDWGVEIMKNFGKYNYRYNNCQNYVYLFLTKMGIQSPVLPASEKTKKWAKRLTAPLWIVGSAIGTTVLGVGATISAPIWYPIARVKGDAEDANMALLGSLAAIGGVVTGPVLTGMLLFDKDLSNAEAKNAGIEVIEE